MESNDHTLTTSDGFNDRQISPKTGSSAAKVDAWLDGVLRETDICEAESKTPDKLRLLKEEKKTQSVAALDHSINPLIHPWYKTNRGVADREELGTFILIRSTVLRWNVALKLSFYIMYTGGIFLFVDDTYFQQTSLLNNTFV